MKIEMKKQYGWREGGVMGWMKSWYVLDDNGIIVAGHVSQGHNQRASRAYITTRAQAEAWLAGYLDAKSGAIKPISAQLKRVSSADSNAYVALSGAKLRQHMRRFYEDGARKFWLSEMS